MAYPILAPNSTWYKSSALRSTITEINIVDSYTPTGSETESWNADVDNNGSIKCYRNGTVLTIAGNGSGKIAMNADSSSVFADTNKIDYFLICTAINGINLLDSSGVTNLARGFAYCQKLTELDLSSWDVSNVTTFNYAFGSNSTIGIRKMSLTMLKLSGISNKCTSFRSMFQNCNDLTTLDVSNWDTSSVTSMRATFSTCSSLMSLDVSNWDTSSVTDMNSTFANCVSLTALDISNWDTSSVTDMYFIFGATSSYGKMALTTLDVSNWDVSNVTNMSCMFQFCSNLTSLNLASWNVGKVINMKYMFTQCEKLTTIGDVSNWDVGKVTDMGFMFNKCTSLTTIGNVSNWDVGKVTTFKCMFQGGNYGNPAMKIKNLNVSNWNTSSCTDMSYMFYGCSGGLGAIDVSKWDVSKVTTFDHMFAHSYLKIGDVSNWYTPAATNMNAMFYSVANETLDVSKLVTKNVTCFDQMFENCQKLTKIIGLEKFDTSSSYGFSEMFQNCYMLKELDLSSFDTRKAKDGFAGSSNGSATTSMADIFTNMRRLEKITIGANFSFNGDGTSRNIAVLSTPNPEYIPGATGAWYTEEGIPYSSEEVLRHIPGTYYAFNPTGKEYLVKAETIKQLADAVRAKTGKSETINLVDMVTEIGEIPCGDTSMEDGFVTKTLSVYENNRVSSIGSYAFYNCSSLTSVSFPACTTIGGNALASCSSLTSVSFPACTTIGSSAFYSCSRLTSISFPACTTIGSYALAYCSSLTSVNFPACTTIGGNALTHCASLTSVSFPACTTINNHAFTNCTSLTSVSFPACTAIDRYAFQYCSSLTSIYLGASSVCTLSNSNAFSKTGIWSNKGSIFVPASLVSSYKTATNWTFFSNRIYSSDSGETNSGGVI